MFLAYNLDGNDFIEKKLKFHLVESLNFRLETEKCKYDLLK